MIRSIIFHILYWKNKIFLKNVKLRGYCVIFSFKGCEIKLGKGCVNSSFTSNMLGLWQRSIFVARYGGKIKK